MVELHFTLVCENDSQEQVVLDIVKSAKHPDTGLIPLGWNAYRNPDKSLKVVVGYPDPQPPKPSIDQLFNEWRATFDDAARCKLWTAVIGQPNHEAETRSGVTLKAVCNGDCPIEVS